MFNAATAKNETAVMNTAKASPKVTAAMLNEQAATPGHEWVDFTVRFRKTKDQAGNEIPARAPIDLVIRTLTAEGVKDMLDKGGKEAQLIVEACAEIVINRAKEIVTELLADNKEVNAETFPIDACGWEAIANLPQAERKGRGISQELWEAFVESYTKYFLSKGFEQTKVETAAGIFVKRFQSVKTNKPMLEKLREYLSAWFNDGVTDDDAGLVEVYKFLSGKLEEFLASDPTADLNRI